MGELLSYGTESVFNRQSTRREVLGGALRLGALSLTGLGLSACDNEAQISNEFIRNQENLKGYKAAGGVIIGDNYRRGRGINDSNYIGHAGLFEKNGRLRVVTVEHVVRLTIMDD